MKIGRKPSDKFFINGLLLGLALGCFILAYLGKQKSDASAVVEPIPTQNELEDNLKRDKAVAESFALYTDEGIKLACDAYVKGLKEQQLTVSQVIAEACKM